MDALQREAGGRGCRRFSHGLAALALAWSGGTALAQDVVSVPAAHLNHAEGTVAYAPQGEREWQDVQPRRLLKRGDRLWTDRGSRAEVQAGGHALRLDGQTQLVLENVGDAATQLSVTQGSIVATVTGLHPGDSFEVGTPNLAFRARQPGDYRIDVDRGRGLTRLVVLSGAGVVFGEKGEALEVRNGQRLTFRARDLTRVQQPAFAISDDFDRWAGARRRGEPTVSMPALARSEAAPPPHTQRVSSGPDIVIAGPASALPGAKPAAAAAPKAQAIPNVVLTPAVPAAVPLRVAAPAAPAAPAQPQEQPDAEARAKAEAAARLKAEHLARARAQEEARAKAQAARAREQQEQKRVAQQRADERRRALAARREEQRREAQARREQEEKRVAAAKRAEEERRQAQARRAAEEKRLAAARKAEEAQRSAQARKQQLARLQEQARRDEQAAQARREQQARRAEEDRREAQARREELARREEQVRRGEQARREEDDRRRMLAEQERREQEVWLRQQRALQPVRPPPMGVPFRRVS